MLDAMQCNVTQSNQNQTQADTILNPFGLQIYFKGFSINLHFDWITNLTSQLIELHRLRLLPSIRKAKNFD